MNPIPLKTVNIIIFIIEVIMELICFMKLKTTIIFKGYMLNTLTQQPKLLRGV